MLHRFCCFTHHHHESTRTSYLDQIFKEQYDFRAVNFEIKLSRFCSSKLTSMVHALIKVKLLFEPIFNRTSSKRERYIIDHPLDLQVLLIQFFRTEFHKCSARNHGNELVVFCCFKMRFPRNLALSPVTL